MAFEKDIPNNPAAHNPTFTRQGSFMRRMESFHGPLSMF
jgi:hypothetical protein